MNIKEDLVSILKDTREYLLYLKETAVEELPAMNGETKQTLSGQSVYRAVYKSEDKAQRLNNLRAEIGDCRRCKLWIGRTNIVFGTGNPCTRLMFVGEGPGEEEDIQGKPFVGKAGALLTNIIEAMGITRDDVYIANVIKCRPPKNRNPEEDEISACRPFLEGQIEIIRPQIICTLGTFATQTLLDTKSRISELRGKKHEKNGCIIVPTFHPAYLLRNPQDKRLVWEDIKMIMKELGLKEKTKKKDITK